LGTRSLETARSSSQKAAPLDPKGRPCAGSSEAGHQTSWSSGGGFKSECKRQAAYFAELAQPVPSLAGAMRRLAHGAGCGALHTRTAARRPGSMGGPLSRRCTCTAPPRGPQRAHRRCNRDTCPAWSQGGSRVPGRAGRVSR
jgi:hypothetical protein